MINTRPRYKTDLPAQQAECEINYFRLCQLLPDVDLSVIGDDFVYSSGRFPLESTIRFFVTEQTKYTTLVHITQQYSLKSSVPWVTHASVGSDHYQNTGGVLPTNGQERGELVIYKAGIRLYHDVKLAEVVECQEHRYLSARYQYPNEKMFHVDEKAQTNRFLGELLQYCIEHGAVTTTVTEHLFTPK